ncbi:MAG: hypothetical protein IVW57_03260 [Ktedonobacterales bacterium]|nr:hypothetical protein [Ktedonobacterales bacterium]
MRRILFGMWVTLAGLTAAVALVGCGATGSGGGGLYGAPPAGGTTSPTATNVGTPTVATRQAVVAGKSMTILTDARGMTLYYLTADTATATACTYYCARTWSPLTTSATPTSGATLPGTLSTLTDANGPQVTYNGHPLYTSTYDRVPGDTRGEGSGGMWFVATPALAVLSGATVTAIPGY